MHHDQHSGNSFLSAGGSQPKDHPRSYGPDKMNFCKDVCKDKVTGLGDSNSCPDVPPRPLHDHLPKSSPGLGDAWTYLRWCVAIVPLVLRSRTPLASFLSRTIQMSKSLCTRTSLASTFFPVPIPFFGVFGRMPERSSASKRHTCHISRAIHVIVMTLNHWHLGGRWCDLELLRREPSRQHVSLFRRLRFLIRSDWPAEIPHLPVAGRRFPQLVARLSELSDCLTRLGPSVNPYDKAFDGCDVPIDNSVMPELSPYRDLDPSRLRIKGSGAWDATPFLDDRLCMVYKEPAIIRFCDMPSVIPHNRDTAETVGELAKIWDCRGLLLLHDRPVGRYSHVRIFNTLKSETQDRQIGDRRAMNSQEGRIRGASSDLPAGYDLTSLVVDPRSQSILISITDRSDFYHQFQCSESRAVTNTILPSVPVDLISSTDAYASFLASRVSRRPRERSGDHLGEGSRPSSLLVPPEDGRVWVAFRSVLQGDHAGVDIATEAHVNLLKCQNLLSEDVRMTASAPLRSFEEAQGLVIDDYFALSIQKKGTPKESSQSAIAYHAAQAAYEKHGLQGSPEKDRVAQEEGRVIGAYVNGSARATSRGMITVGAPIEKRIGLSLLSLFVSQLSHSTDAFHLCLLGGWTSVLGYRRPLMSVLQSAFHLVDSRNFVASDPKLVRLPRQVACELVTLAVLMPLSVSDIAAPIDRSIYCTDASLQKGAILEASVDERIAKILYRATLSKGAYTKMLSTPSSLRKIFDWEFEEEDVLADIDVGDQGPERPLAFSFVFIEVYAGSAKVTRYLSELGVPCGPPLDISLSPEYDLSLIHVICWLCHMVSSRRLRAYMLEPPCTTFSIMRRPRLRSRLLPLGFRPKEEKTHLGNVLASRSGQLLFVGARHGASGVLETPFSSYMKHMPFWKILETYAGFDTIRCDSCRFGSPHLKSFRFLCLNLKTEGLSLRCQCVGKHVPVEGSLTKGSAVYTDDLARALAFAFAESLKTPAEKDESKVNGLESLLINDVMTSSEWKAQEVWTFKKQSHIIINILEEASILRLVSRIAFRGQTVRSLVITDSNVVKCATAKGRTSSKGLGPILRRLCSLLVASGVYLNIAYIPTRLNSADDPTRDHAIRPSVPGFGLSSWSSEDIFKLSSLGRFRRWISNWLRLCILLRGPAFIYVGDRSLYHFPWPLQKKIPLSSRGPGDTHASLDFDSIPKVFLVRGPPFLYVVPGLSPVLWCTCSSVSFLCSVPFVC